ncbi:MAG: dTDP-glucose 4,6-dehydratase [Bacteroidota bacterium]|nr:dTDP-glucose 4,6-dehydratase [Bacteroidota bacterium]
MKNILVTGGAGFIGSNFVRYMLNKYSNYNIINYDKLTYAGNIRNLVGVDKYKNYKFIKADICDYKKLDDTFKSEKIDSVIHFAAESHVDKSILDPFSFVKTNVLGTLNLLEVSRKNWKNDYKGKLFHHISTDEVFGSAEDGLFFNEKTPYDPHSPYSASKASSDHFVRAYFDTYDLPIKISNCSNNYGPFQFPEKFIPLIIYNIINKKELPIYGDGQNIRDWIHVYDHVDALDLIFHKGLIGETYLVGANDQRKNIEIVNIITDFADLLLQRENGSSKDLIRFVEDRPGHDKRYAIDTEKIYSQLGWKPKINLKNGIKKTIEWYIENKKWIDYSLKKNI